MTSTDQHTTWLKFHVFQAKIEKKYTPVLQKTIAAQIDVFNAHAKEVGYPQAASKIYDYFDPAPIMTIVNNIHTECAGKWGASVYNQFKNVKSRLMTAADGTMHVKHENRHDLKRSTFNITDDIAKEIVNELRLSLLNNVHGIEDSIKEQILYYIQQGQINGWAYDKTAAEIKDKVGSLYRSQRIVRTESVKASNMGGMAGAKRTGLLMDKVWINAKDIRVRGNPAGKPTQFDHWDIGGVTIPIDQAFLLGSRTTGNASDSLQFPGDPSGNPADIINCRCTLGFIPKRDSDGLPIRIAPRVNTTVI